MQHTIKNVTALWPRINRPYKFDSVEQRSAPCDAADPMGAYEMSFEMTRDAAKDLWAEMLKAYASKKQAGWPDKPVSPFKTSDDGTVIGKVKLKSSYNGELTKAPLQVDAANKKLPDDFLLTTGSTIKTGTYKVTPTFTFEGKACAGPDLPFTIKVLPKPILLVNFDFQKVNVKGSKARIKYTFYPFWKICDETGPSPSYSNGLFINVDVRFKKESGLWSISEAKIEDMDFDFSKGIPGYGCLNKHYIPF